MTTALDPPLPQPRLTADPGRPTPKVPQVDGLFWVAKLTTTVFGEAFSDYAFFNDYLGQHRAILLGLGFLVLCLTAQLATRDYRPWVYWLTVAAVSIFGTMSADFLNQDLGLSLTASTGMLLVLQVGVFAAWWRSERTLDMHSITTRRRELFYWATVILTFALGTAAGDFAATTLALGTLASTLLFLGVVALITAVALPLARRRNTSGTADATGTAGTTAPGLGAVLGFWAAYSMTRPLGASFADWLGVPAPYGDGLQLGTGPISLVSGVALLAVVTAVSLRHRRPAASAG